MKINYYTIQEWRKSHPNDLEEPIMKAEKRILNVTLKNKWFDMWSEGKDEEYRAVTPYWIKRLCNKHEGSICGDFMDKHKCLSYTFKKFDIISGWNGGYYGGGLPNKRREILGISIGKAVPEWSDNWQGDVFVIKLGKIL